MKCLGSLSLFALCSLVSFSTASAQCPEWSSGFNSPGVEGAVYAQLAHNDGSGEKLYVGGDFKTAGAAIANGVAVWDGTSWSDLGLAQPERILALAFYDDGSGEALYAGGKDTLQRYDGNSWTSIPLIGEIRALHVYDDGSGPALFAGGTLTLVNGLSVGRLARYDGTWSNVSTGINGFVNALETFDDGSGEKLFVAGRFSSAGGVPALSIARWDGVNFSALGAGVNTTQFSESAVNALQAYVDGLSGNRGLYVGGIFNSAGGFSAQNWARYSQVGWQALPNGMNWLYDFDVQRTANGNVLWAASYQVRSWDGVSLGAPLPVLDHDPRSIAAFSTSGDEDIHVGSDYVGINQSAHGLEKNPIVRWDGAQWSTLGTGVGIGSRYDVVRSFVVHDFGSGPELAVGGKFHAAGGETAGIVARFDGAQWHNIGDNLNGWGVYALESFDDGGGSEQLYAAGSRVGFDASPRIAMRFNGTNWEEVGPAVNSSAEYTFALETFDDGGGPRLFAGGDIQAVGGVTLNDIGEWNGSAWVGVGGGMAGGGIFQEVHALTVYNDGGGDDLIAGGRFESAGGVTAAHVASWDGVNWSALGLGVDCLDSLAAPCINAMTTWNSPDGAVLVVTGYLDMAGGAPANGIATWDGSSWSTLGSGLEGPSFPTGYALAAFDPDGNGEQLYVAGNFEAAGGVPASGFAVWDGVSWSVPAQVDGLPRGFGTFDDSDGRALFMGGSFASVGDVPATNLARFDDVCGQDLGVPRCTSNENSTGQRALLRADGTTSVAAQSIDMTAKRLPAGQLTLLFNGTDRVQVPIGDGVLCLTSNVLRMYPAGFADGSGEYNVSLDFGSAYAANFLAGTTLQFQGWYRDVAGGPAGFNTTDALEITFVP